MVILIAEVSREVLRPMAAEGEVLILLLLLAYIFGLITALVILAPRYRY